MCVRSFLHNFESEQSEAHFEKHLMQQHGVKSLQCGFCQFKIRKKGSRETLRRMMDQHIIENHYSSVEANEISSPKQSVDRVKKMALKQDRTVSHSEKSMERFKVKIVTQGKYLNRSLIFHIEDTLADKHYETYLNCVNSKSFNLR